MVTQDHYMMEQVLEIFDSFEFVGTSNFVDISFLERNLKVNHKYISMILLRCYRHGYLNRMPDQYKIGKTHGYMYYITEKGRDWLNKQRALRGNNDYITNPPIMQNVYPNMVPQSIPTPVNNNAGVLDDMMNFLLYDCLKPKNKFELMKMQAWNPEIKRIIQDYERLYWNKKILAELISFDS